MNQNGNRIKIGLATEEQVNGPFGFCRATPSVALKQQEVACLWGSQTFFASLLGCGWGWYDCIRRIPEEPKSTRNSSRRGIEPSRER